MCCLEEVYRCLLIIYYCDKFSIVIVYLDHLKFCVKCINSLRYVCCGECYVVSNVCDEPTSCLVQPIGTHCCVVMLCLFFSLFMLTCSMMRFLSLLLLGLCACVMLVVLW